MSSTLVFQERFPMRCDCPKGQLRRARARLCWSGGAQHSLSGSRTSKIASQSGRQSARRHCLLFGALRNARGIGEARGRFRAVSAVCPIVYPVDQFPSQRGYRYLFYGNGFFINEQGYFITAAHVLSPLHGGQAYILLRQTAGAPQFVPATLVVVDRDHDVAVLRATPNPFEGKYKVGFLPLAYDWRRQGHAVLAASLLPPWPRDAYTLSPLVDYRSHGEVFDFQFFQLDKGRSDTELFLFNHQVRRGQSGAPIVSTESQGVVGFVEGQWLRSSLVPLETVGDQGTPGVGAGVPVHYAIALLQRMGIPWHTASRPLEPSDNSAGRAEDYSAPTPFLLVASSYPSQALFGGEVVLDALIDSGGRLAETKVVHGRPLSSKTYLVPCDLEFFPGTPQRSGGGGKNRETFNFRSRTSPRIPRRPTITMRPRQVQLTGRRCQL